MCISVTGVLRRTNAELADEWKGAVRVGDVVLVKGSDIRKAFQAHLDDGHQVIPFGEKCEGFDYSGKGCPGHPMADDEEG
jgi:hypothetical protein